MDQNEKIENALSDITLIKQTMGKSRVEIECLSKLLFLYGGIQAVLVAAFWVINFLVRGIEIPVFQFLIFMNLSVIIIGIFFFAWRHRIRKTENNYTLVIYDAWGYALFPIPAVWLFTLLLQFVFPETIGTYTLHSSLTMFLTLEQVLFFVVLALTAFLVNSESWKILSVIFLVLYALSFICFGQLPNEGVDTTLVLDFWGSIQFFWSMLCPIIAIVLGLYLRHIKKTTTICT